MAKRPTLDDVLMEFLDQLLFEETPVRGTRAPGNALTASTEPKIPSNTQTKTPAPTQ